MTETEAPRPQCRNCGAPPKETRLVSIATTNADTGDAEKVGEPVTQYDLDGGYSTGAFEHVNPAYRGEINDPGLDTETLYAECKACGERAEDIHELLGWDESRWVDEPSAAESDVAPTREAPAA